MLETVEQRNALLASIERARNSTVVAYILHDNAVIADDALPHLYDKLHAIGRRERIDLLLSARGGVPEVCWRILNLLREYCDHLAVIVGTRVQGAASLLALGADEIIMGPLSEVGGVDSIRKHPLMPHDEIGQPLPVSLGEIKSLFSFLSEQGGSHPELPDGEIQNPKLTSDTMSALFQYIHPLTIAHLQQADALSREITRKALKQHMHPENADKMEQIVDLFNGGFHSPIYTASRAELREMGLPVEEPEKELWSSIWGLVQLYQAAIYTERPDQTMPGTFFRYICMIETSGRSTGLHQSFTQVEGQERIVQIRWETAIKSSGPGPSIGPGGMSNN